MRYLKNNGVPSKINIYVQGIVKYFNKEGEHKMIRLIKWGNPDNETDESNKEARELMIPKNKKAVIYHSFKNGRWVEDNEERRDVGYSFIVWNFPHVLDIPVGNSARDERRYSIKVGEIAEVENEEDADQLMRTYWFLDEVDQQGHTLKVRSKVRGHEGIMVDGNAYRGFESKRADLSQAPRHYDEFDPKLAPRKTSMDQRVNRILYDETLEEDKK